MTRNRFEHPPFAEDDGAHDGDAQPDSGLPGWGPTFRRTGTIAWVAALILAVVAVLSGWTSPYEFARAIAVGGAVLFAMGMLVGISATSTSAQHAIAHPTIPHRMLENRGERDENGHEMLYGVMVPMMFAAILLIAAGILGMQLS